MNSLIPTIAAQINQEHRAAETDATSAVEHARRAGALLTEAKKQQPHGAWLPWLAANCPQISERKAQAYMQLARNPEIQGASIRAAMALLVSPKAQRAADLPPGGDDLPSGAFSSDFIELYIEASAKGALREARLEGSVVSIEQGCVTVGYKHDEPDNPVHVLFESRRHRGYWYSVHLDRGVTVRPMVAFVWQAILEREIGIDWGMVLDDGHLLSLAEPRSAAAA